MGPEQRERAQSVVDGLCTTRQRPTLPTAAGICFAQLRFPRKNPTASFSLAIAVIARAPSHRAPLASLPAIAHRAVDKPTKWPRNPETLGTETRVVPRAISTTTATVVTTATAATSETTPRPPRDRTRTAPPTRVCLPVPRPRRMGMAMATAAHTAETETITTRRPKIPDTRISVTVEISAPSAPPPITTARPRATLPFAQRSRAAFKTSPPTTTGATTTTSAQMIAAITARLDAAPVAQGAVATPSAAEVVAHPGAFLSPRSASF